MFDQDQLTDVDSGSKFTVGKLKNADSTYPFLKRGALICEFDGVDAALDYLGRKMPTPKREGSSDTRGTDGGFYKFTSYAKAMETFRKNPESIVKFDEAELRIRDYKETGNMVEYDVQGDYIDMGRFMEGVPETFGSLFNGTARNRRVSLIIDTNQVSRMTEREINHRSERILRLVDALEAGGARCEMIARDANECGATSILLKKHEETLALPDLAIVTHSDWKRRLIFRINEHSDTWQYGYGRAYSYQDSVEPSKIESENVNEVTIFIGGSMTEIDEPFDKLERLLSWELSKPVPEVSSIKIGRDGIYFNENGSRDSEEIRAEGQAILDGDG